jgi:hypothetical protein
LSASRRAGGGGGRSRRCRRANQTRSLDCAERAARGPRNDRARARPALQIQAHAASIPTLVSFRLRPAKDGDWQNPTFQIARGARGWNTYAGGGLIGARPRTSKAARDRQQTNKGCYEGRANVRSLFSTTPPAPTSAIAEPAVCGTTEGPNDVRYWLPAS